MQKENRDFRRREKNEEMISRNCVPHHKRACTFPNKNKVTPLYLLSRLSRYYATSENVQRDRAEIAKKKTLISRGEKK
jgi:hypothetical protein